MSPRSVDVARSMECEEAEGHDKQAYQAFRAFLERADNHIWFSQVFT